MSESDLGVIVTNLAGVDTTVKQQGVPSVFAAEREGDDIAATIAARASDHFAEVALHLIARLQSAEGLIAAIDGGMLLKQESYACRVKRRLTSIARDAKVVRSVMPPVAGALLKGLASLVKSMDHQLDRKVWANALICTTEDPTYERR